MTEIYRVPVPLNSDGMFLKFKDYLINAVNPEMQKQSAFQQGGRDAIRQLLLDALIGLGQNWPRTPVITCLGLPWQTW